MLLPQAGVIMLPTLGGIKQYYGNVECMFFVLWNFLTANHQVGNKPSAHPL